MSVSGDAPKELIHIYRYTQDNKFHKKNQKLWPLFIAKTGHKWYPNESITEYLLNQLGTVFGLRMADSDLLIIAGQVRFLSRYFLRFGKEELVHGAEIFAGYLSQDIQFVEAVESARLSRDFFTLQFVEKSVSYSFPEWKDSIMKELVRLLLFDALVGNNDRHYYNWAVIRSATASVAPTFSPIYDTARGLFWNIDDVSLRKWEDPKEMHRKIERYANQSKPKLGWDGMADINHFTLVEKMYQSEFYFKKSEYQKMFSDDILAKMIGLVNEDFDGLFSSLRKEMVIKCLEYRYYKIKSLMQ